MNEKKVPFTGEQLEAIIAHYPTPFHIYDAKGIVENIRRFIKAFSWAKDFKEYFAVKATPNPYIMRLLQKEGVGADCSSLAELVLCEKVGITGSDIIFSSNDTPYEEYAKALEMGAIINLDDITHIAYIEKHNGCLPERLCFRYNPGSLKEGGNTIIGLPEEAKYGMTQDQIIEAVMYCKDHGVSHFGLHTMVVSNELDINGLIGTAELMFDLALLVKEKTGVEVEFIAFGGGIGGASKAEHNPVSFAALRAGIKKAYEEKIEGNGHSPISLAFECGRMVTGPYGYLVATAIHRKDIYKHYIGLDACMANLMRPALYGSYHHITVMGKEQATADHVYDVTVSQSEN
uniref:diaminopimelate decarboxylase n=1 Tax=Veillonella magna TaxID=464322 RepID=UPI00402A7CB0